MQYQDRKAVTTTRYFTSVEKINAELARLGPTLIRLRHVQTSHVNLPTHNTWAGPLYEFPEADALRTGKMTGVTGTIYPFQNHPMAGFFRDANDREYFMVGNKINARSIDVAEANLATQVTLTFRKVVPAIERLDRQTGNLEQLQLNDHSFTFNLPAGTGNLFKSAEGTPFAGTTPLPLITRQPPPPDRAVAYQTR